MRENSDNTSSPLPLHSSTATPHLRWNPRNRLRGIIGASDLSEENTSSQAINTVADVCAWLTEIGYPQYANVFTANEITGSVLKTLTSEELRDDLGVTNLRQRRELLEAIAKLAAKDGSSRKDALPEHGRILDHLSNVRTYHSWIRVGVQLLAFSIVTLRLAPNFRDTPIVTAAAFYFACVGVIALLYGIYRYRAVIHMIEGSGPSTQKYTPDKVGVLSMLVLVLVGSALSLAIIALRET